MSASESSLDSVYTRTQEATSQLQDDSQEDEEIRVLNLVDHFTALLLAVYLEAGLLEVCHASKWTGLWLTETCSVTRLAYRGSE